MITVKTKAADQPVRIKAGVYGPSGAGKTRLGSLAYITRPGALLHIVTEGQAEVIVRLWNPEAQVIVATSFGDVRLAYEYAARGFKTGFVHVPSQEPGQPVVWTKTDVPFDVETIVVDSASDIFRTLKAEVASDAVRRAASKHLSKTGSMDGFASEEEDITFRDWDNIQTKMLSMLRGFRDLPCNLLVIYAQEEKEDKALGTVKGPYLQGKDLKASTMGLFNAFGYAYRRPATATEREAGRPDIIREVAFVADERYSTKSLDGLSGVEAPDFRAWHRKFREFMLAIAEKRAKALAKGEPAPAPPSEQSQETAEPQVTPAVEEITTTAGDVQQEAGKTGEE